MAHVPDPATVPDTAAEAAVPPDAREEHGTLSEQVEEARWRYYVLDSPTLSDAEFDARDEAARGAGGRAPVAAHPGLADPAGGRCGVDGVHRGRPPRAHDEPRQRLLARGAGRLGAAADPRGRQRRGVPLRAEGRRARDQPALREGPARARAHPWRRPHRGGRHPQRAHHRRHPDPAHGDRGVPGAGAGGGARRGVPARARPSSVSTSRWPTPASRCSPTPATPRQARCARRTRASPPPGRWAWSATASAPGAASSRPRSPWRTTPCGPGASRPATGPRSSRGWRRSGPTSSTTASTATTSSTRSTASWSRSTTSRSSGGSARPAGRRGGRSPSSTRPRRSTRSCWPSRSTPAAPAGSRPSASWSRRRWRARPWSGPPCTTPTRCGARTSGPATPSCCARPATSSPRSWDPCCRCGPRGWRSG